MKVSCIYLTLIFLVMCCSAMENPTKRKSHLALRLAEVRAEEGRAQSILLPIPTNTDQIEDTLDCFLFTLKLNKYLEDPHVDVTIKTVDGKDLSSFQYPLRLARAYTQFYLGKKMYEASLESR